jgi:glutathione reductase (NADPH)
MSSYDFDLFVVGAGSGGVRAARVAASHGAKVAIAEEYRFGGTCVIRGCIPKKLLVYASRFRDEFEDAVGFGWSSTTPRFDWPTLIANKDAEIARLEGIYRSLLEKSGVQAMAGRAELTDAHSLLVQPGNRKVTARLILIATGGHPVLLEVPGAGHAMTSNEAFHLERLPASMLVVGGGYIAVEFASIFQAFGVATTLLYRGPKILRGFDEDLRDGLTTELLKRGIDVVCGAEIVNIDKGWSGLKATLKDGRSLEAGQIMFATGRKPNTAGIGLESAGVQLGANGQIAVDGQSRSSVPNIYAVGDVTDRVNLTPVAIREGQAFAESVFGSTPTPVDHTLVPTAVFSTPELGSVGFPEHIARQRFTKLDIYKARFKPLKHTLSGRDERMLMKLVVDADTDRVVGCHVLGPDAAEIVQMATIALRLKATKADFDTTMALHPTLSEELVTIREKWQPPGVGPLAPKPLGKRRKANEAA